MIKTSIPFKLILIYILNISDLLFTLILLQTGYIIEANPIMQPVVSDPILSICYKIILPALLLLYLFERVKQANQKEIFMTHLTLCFLILIYGIINVSHLFLMLLINTF